MIVQAWLYAALLASPGEAYPGAPAPLTQRLNEALSDFFEQNDDHALDNKAAELAFLAVVDAVVDRRAQNSSAELDVFLARAETARIDKQLGASPSARNATSVVAKPTVSSLLSLALEHGAAERTDDGTNITISTTPFSIARALPISAGVLEEGLGFLRHVGINVSMPVDGSSAADITDYSLRLMLGSREVNRTALADRFRTKLLTAAQASVDATSGAQSDLLTQSVAFAGARDAFIRFTAERQRASGRDVVRSEILRELHQTLYLPFLGAEGRLSSEATEQILKNASELLATEAELKAVHDEIRADSISPVFAFDFGRHDRKIDLPFWDARVSAQATVSNAVQPFEVVFNGEASWLDTSDLAPGRKRLRDFALGLAVEAGWDTPFAAYAEKADASQVTLSLSARARFLQEQDDLLVTGLAQIVVPAIGGLKLPISASLASRTEQRDQVEAGVEIGVSLDFATLAALAGIAAPTTDD